MHTTRLLVALVLVGVARATVVIVGGGITGISTARDLFDAGIEDFVVLEARPAIGGRMLSVDLNGHRVQPGANWISGMDQASDGTYNPIWEIAMEMDLPGAEVDWDSNRANNYYDERGDLMTPGQTNSYWNDLYNAFGQIRQFQSNLDEDDPANWNISTGDGLRMFGWQAGMVGEEKRLTDMLTWTVVEWDSCCGADDINMMGSYRTQSGKWNDGVRDFMVRGGFEQIPNYLARDFQDKIITNAIVTDVARDADGVTVVSTAGTFRADQVVVTVSIAQLRRRAINFIPPLPPQQEDAISRFTNAETNIYARMYLEFPEVFWPDQLEYFYYVDPVLRGAHVAWINYNHVKYNEGSRVLEVDQTGVLGARMEALPEAIAVEEAMVVLRRIFGDDIPEPTAVFRSNWANSQFFGMSYSEWPVGFTRNDKIAMCAPTPDQQLFLAGEACSQEYYGFTHGGLLEGRRVAADVLTARKGYANYKN